MATVDEQRNERLREAADRGRLSFAIEKLSQSINKRVTQDQRLNKAQNVARLAGSTALSKGGGIISGASLALTANPIIASLIGGAFNKLQEGFEKTFDFLGESREERQAKKQEVMLAKQLGINEEEFKLLKRKQEEIEKEEKLIDEQRDFLKKFEDILGIEVGDFQKGMGTFELRDEDSKKFTSIANSLEKFTLGEERGKLGKLEEKREDARRERPEELVETPERKERNVAVRFKNLLGALIPGFSLLSGLITPLLAGAAGGALVRFLGISQTFFRGLGRIAKFFIKRIAPLVGIIEVARAAMSDEELPEAIASFFGGIAEAFSFGLIDGNRIKDIVANSIRELSQGIKGIFNEGFDREHVKKIFQGVIGLAATPFDFVVQTFANITAKIFDWLGFDETSQKVSEIFDNVRPIERMKDEVAMFVDKVFNFFENIFPSIRDDVEQGIEKLIDNIKTAIRDVLNFDFSSFIDKITPGFLKEDTPLDKLESEIRKSENKLRFFRSQKVSPVSTLFKGEDEIEKDIRNEENRLNQLNRDRARFLRQTPEINQIQPGELNRNGARIDSGSRSLDKPQTNIGPITPITTVDNSLSTVNMGDNVIVPPSPIVSDSVFSNVTGSKTFPH